MRRTGRELTLFGIYGTPSGDGPRRKPTAKGGSDAVRPTRPTGPSRATALRGPLRSALRKPLSPPRKTQPRIEADSHDLVRDDGDDEREEAALTGNVGVNRTQEQPSSPPRSRVPSPVLSPKTSPRSKSPNARAEGGKRFDALPPQAVVSLYGDGFIELAPRAAHGSALTVPFTLQIRLFKAAHESMERNAIESDASRHVSPELNDEGAFVRWSCCGSTDKSVFGCPVASDEQIEKLTVEELLKLRPPKLIACKLTACKSDPLDSLRFVIFDRGYPAQFTPGEVGTLNAGCRIWWQGYECWATAYDIPHDCWVNFTVSFDGKYLQIRIDGELVDTAVVHHSTRVPPPVCRAYCVLGCLCPNTAWFNPSSTTGSVYIGGYSKYSKRVNAWRVRGGFVGLIARVKLTVGDRLWHGAAFDKDDKRSFDPGYYAYIVATDACEVTDLSTPNKLSVIVHRNVFWRNKFPPFVDASVQPTIRLLGNFYHGAHHDVSPRGQASFENLLLSTVQVGDVRIRIELSKQFVPTFGSEHGCRTQTEYDLKCNAFVRQLESWSPLLIVSVNASEVKPSIGSFEVSLELFRTTGCLVAISLHSMIATSCFPSLKDVRAKICDIISLEARRSPGEGVIHQAFRSFLSLAEQARDNRERAFMVSVMNRKAVITEKRIIDVFERIGFHFSQAELHDLIRLFKTMQNDYQRHQHRMDDIPTMSLLAPTSTGLYCLPLIHQASLNAITPSERSALKSKWQFIATLLNYDLQLLDFVQSGCPESAYGNASYAQSRYLHGGFVDRFCMHVSEVPSHVYCILFSLRRRCADHHTSPNGSSSQLQPTHEAHDAVVQGGEGKNERILVQLENGETLQQLAQFEVEPTGDCKWLSLAALYRSRKTQLWRFQVLGGSTHAGSIHNGLEQMNAILVDRHIVQVYEVVVSYEISEDTPEFADFAGRFAKNIRFGRNGKIHMVARTRSENARRNAVAQDAIAIEPSSSRQAKLAVALRIRGVSEEIIVYRHDVSASSLPTVQSVCRSILRALADHGIKESLQQNPFVAGAKKIKRSVTIRVTTEDTNAPVAGAYIFVEKNLDNQKAVSSLASKIVPTLTMGSRLVSIRRRLQKKKYSEEGKIAARSFVETVIGLGTRYAMVSLRDSKLVPIIKSRAILRRAMRRRHEWIKEGILNAMSESERSRLYSRNGPTRLQQLFRPTLNFTPSEKELVNGVVEMELDAFRRELGLLKSGQSEGNDIEAVWQSHINEDHSASGQGDQSSHAKLDTPDGQDRPETEGGSEQAVKKPKRSYQTGVDGAITCQLAPGSYSLYVFHVDYFEWTSLAVVFPTVNASGMYGGTFSTSAPQEIVVPLETFKWSYAIQLVDFYHQHIHKHVEGVPVVIIDKVTSEETILMSRPDGSVAWDVRKGIYAVRVPTEGTSIVYSGSKNVVVDGGRYHPPRTVFIPILVGKVTVDLTVSGGVGLEQRSPSNGTAKIQIVAESDRNRFAGFLSLASHADDALGKVNAHVHPINSTTDFQLRPGRYALAVTADGYFPYSLALHAPWNANGADGCRELAVLCPVFSGPNAYRATFSYVNGTGILNAMVEVEEQQVTKRTYWKHGVRIPCDDVTFHDTWALDSCEYQTFTIACLHGRSYHLRVAMSADVQCRLHSLRPRVQVYDASGLVADIVLQEGINWHGEFYWSPCSWSTLGELVPVDELPPPERVE